VCIFVIALTTVIVVSIVDTQTLHMTAQRHTMDYQKALYLAAAGMHHAISQVDGANQYFQPFTLGPVEFPAGSGNTYSAQAVLAGSELVVTSTGTAGGVTRRLQATLVEEYP